MANVRLSHSAGTGGCLILKNLSDVQNVTLLEPVKMCVLCWESAHQRYILSALMQMFLLTQDLDCLSVWPLSGQRTGTLQVIFALP